MQITEKEFDILKAEFMKNVVNGADIYHKTTPAEWEAFERTIRENGPFDIVMDGLNVAYLSSNERSKRISGKGRPDAHSVRIPFRPANWQIGQMFTEFRF